MRNGLLGAVATLLAGSGLALAQAPIDMKPYTPMARLPLLAPAQSQEPAAELAPAPRPVAPPPATGAPAVAGHPVGPVMPGPEVGPNGPVVVGPNGPVEAGGHGSWFGGWGCCGGGGDAPYYIWTDLEYLLWWSKRSNIPPLATFGVNPTNGVLGAQGTLPVITGSNLEPDDQSGGRFTFGWWVNQYNDLGVETTFLFLDTDTKDHAAASNAAANAPVLAEPFRSAFTGAEAATVLAGPGFGSGAIVATDTLKFWGGEVNAIIGLCRGNNTRVDLLAGARYIKLEDHLGIASFTAPLAGAGAQVSRNDAFDAETNYTAGQLGLRAEYGGPILFANAVAKLALGDSHEVVKVGGNTLVALPTAPPAVLPGGFFAQPTNSGRRSRDEFAVLPEFGLNVGANLTGCVRIYAGYTFLYLNHVVRAGNQIDRTLNLSQQPGLGRGLVGPPRPLPLTADTDFWVQGVNFGLEFRY
jgi:hypothetical protein